MRDILEDTEAQRLIDPMKSAQGKNDQKWPKRFYEKVSIKEAENGYSVLLDGKTVKTPGKNLLILPGEHSARIVADEWAAVEKEINPTKMPASRIVNTALDGVANQAQAVLEDIIRYAGTDLLCYRAQSPKELVEIQQQKWDPVLDWIDAEIGAQFEVADGIIHVTQPRETIALFGAELKQFSQPVQLACLHTFTSLTGSAILCLALAKQHLDVETVWELAHVDDEWNESLWGEDYEVAQRRNLRKTEISIADQLLGAVLKDCSV